MSAQVSAQAIRRIIIQQSKRANVGHIGSSLSVADLIAALYGGAANIYSPDDPERDRLVLSKGHAVLAVYAALHLRGWISTAQLNTYCGNGTTLGVHPEHVVPGIEMCTGSLGQGISYAGGMALAARLQQSSRRVFALLSDAECNEGVVWEATQFAAHHKLSNLIALIDLNGQQALGYTREVLNCDSMMARWRAFGWHAQEIDGHDVGAITSAIQQLDTHDGAPHALIARTTFGKGVSYMHNQIKWHYLPMDDALYAQALQELGVGSQETVTGNLALGAGN